MTPAKINESNIFAYLFRGSLAATSCLTVISFFAGSPQLAAGVFAGGIISLANFFWLRNILQRVLQLQPQNAQSYTIFRYAVRLAVMSVVIYLLITSRIVDIFGLLIGLSVLVLNIIALSVYLSFKGG